MVNDGPRRRPDGRPASFTLSTERLRLRPFRANDLDDFLAYHNDPAIIRYQSWEAFTRAEGEAFVREQSTAPPLAQGRWSQIAIELAEGGALLGDCAVHIQPDDARLMEIGVTIAPARQGRGYAREALTCLLEHMFRARRIHRAVANIDPRNAPSISLFERLGFTREGHLRENEWIHGEWCDTLVYACLARDWASA